MYSTKTGVRENGGARLSRLAFWPCKEARRHLNNLAGLIEVQGRYPEAEELYRQVLDISLATLGRDHPTTKTCEDNLKSLLEKMKKGFSEK